MDESTLRERRPAASSANSAPSSHSSNAARPVHPDALQPRRRGGWCRFLPAILICFGLFLLVSYFATPDGSLTFGAGPILGQRAMTTQLAPILTFLRPVTRQFHRAHRALHQLLGLRSTVGKRKKKQKSRLDAAADSPDAGYGGATPVAAPKPAEPVQTPDGEKPSPLANSGAARPGKAYVPHDIRVPPPEERDPKELYLTPEELAEHTGADGASSIFLSVYNRIFDVTPGRNFYGPSGSYAHMAGRDNTRAFATNCWHHADRHDVRGLSYEQKKAADGWYDFYARHHTYRPVGWLLTPPIPDDKPIPEDNENC